MHLYILRKWDYLWHFILFCYSNFNLYHFSMGNLTSTKNIKYLFINKNQHVWFVLCYVMVYSTKIQWKNLNLKFLWFWRILCYLRVEMFSSILCVWSTFAVIYILRKWDYLGTLLYFVKVTSVCTTFLWVTSPAQKILQSIFL